MSDRRDYYFRQKVTEAELDVGFNTLEQADFNFAIDNIFTGVISGLGVSEAAVPDLTVDVQGPGVAYSKDGERTRIASTQNVDMSQDDGAVSTAVGGAGNTKVVSLFIEFDRALSDPRIDGNGLTVYFVRAESFAFSVVQGAEALIGTEVPPPLSTSKILLADIRMVFGGTTITNAAVVGAFDQIDTTRREDAFKFTAGGITITEGTAYDAIDALVTGVNAHIAGSANKHAATAITATDTATWRDGTTLDGATVVDDVQEALDAILTDLSLQASGNDGAGKIGSYETGAWHDGAKEATGTVASQIDGIVSSLAATGGADKVGAAAQSVGAEAVTAGSIQDQVGELLTAINSQNAFNQLVRASNFTRMNDLMAAGGVTWGLQYGDAADPIYVAVGVNAGAGEIRSFLFPDGAATTRAAGGSPTALFDVCYGLGLFVAVGGDGAAGAAIETAPDGKTYTARTPTGMTSASDELRAVIFEASGAAFIAVGDDGSTGEIIRSTDGITWSVATVTPAMNVINGVAHDGAGNAVAVGQNGAGNAAILLSADAGKNWTTEHTEVGNVFTGVCYDAKSTRWFATGTAGAFKSDAGDPTTWTQMVSSDLALCSTSLAADGKGTVIFGGGGQIAITLDGGATFHHLYLGDSGGAAGLGNENSLKYTGGQFWAFDSTGLDAFASLTAFGFYEETI